MPKIAPSVQEQTFSAIDGEVNIQIVHTPGDVNQVTVEQDWPLGLGSSSSNDRNHALYKDAIKAKGYDYANGEFDDWSNFVFPDSVVDSMLERCKGGIQPIVDVLNFRASRSESSTDDRITIAATYEYPSVEKADSFMQSAFGDNRLVIEGFDGSDFPARKMIDAFLAGKILVANSLPHSIHDMADHVIGWIGVDPEYIKVLQQRIAPYVARADAENALPPIPLQDHLPQEESLLLQSYLNPTELLIREIARKIDNFTACLGDVALSGELFEPSGAEEVKGLLEKFSLFDQIVNGDDYVDVPPLILGRLPQGEAAVNHIRKRYSQAIGVAKQIQEASR